ncbi:MAG: endonuclease/exonuclease/phosphatase family protein, partial [Chloroflexota bacterium]|nr:endonuclease/exonuclease/phosphatase family protein [Chloroflexota bacterium]
LVLRAERRAAPNAHKGDALWLTAGLFVSLTLLAAYYWCSGSVAVLAGCGVLFTASALLAEGGSTRESPRLGYGTPVVAVLALLLFAACAGQMAAGSAPLSVASAGPDLTVMTFNIRSGFARDGVWNLEGTARTIEEQAPDVVVLQEVSRGWLGRTGTDEVLWLQRRLGMQVVFGAATDDGLWGNAVLTRLPVVNTEERRFDVNHNLQRSALLVQLQTRLGGAWVLTTHLAAPKDAGTVRLAQTREMLALLRGRRPTLIMGDLNADPDSPELRQLSSAGFADLGRTLGSSAHTSVDRRRIDYILATEEWESLDVRIVEAATSDHRPVVAKMRLRGGGQR